MVGKGQPKKAPENKKAEFNIYISPKQRELIEEAREIESPEKRFGALFIYILSFLLLFQFYIFLLLLFFVKII